MVCGAGYHHVIEMRHGENGQGAVEMALTWPIVFALIVLCLELGLAFYSYCTVVWAAREGARSGAVYLYQRTCDQTNNDANRESGDGICPTRYTENIRDTVEYSMGVLKGFNKTTGINISYTHTPTVTMPLPGETRSGDEVNVEVTYEHHFLTQLFTDRTLTLTGQATARIEP
ncbi:MAG TPA: TadE family protein [Chloroflexota bacterium]|nr:TadE family protein [Chloroflexota bacterium]